MNIVHSAGADTSHGLPQCHCLVLLSLQQKHGEDGTVQSSHTLNMRQAILGPLGTLGNEEQA